MTDDLSSSILCKEEAKLRSLVEEWHTLVSQSNAYNDDLVWISSKYKILFKQFFSSVIFYLVNGLSWSTNQFCTEIRTIMINSDGQGEYAQDILSGLTIFSKTFRVTCR